METTADIFFVDSTTRGVVNWFPIDHHDLPEIRRRMQRPPKVDLPQLVSWAALTDDEIERLSHDDDRETDAQSDIAAFRALNPKREGYWVVSWWIVRYLHGE
jgi:hypothetical protein